MGSVFTIFHNAATAINYEFILFQRNITFIPQIWITIYESNFISFSLWVMLLVSKKSILHTAKEQSKATSNSTIERGLIFFWSNFDVFAPDMRQRKTLLTIFIDLLSLVFFTRISIWLN